MRNNTIRLLKIIVKMNNLSINSSTNISKIERMQILFKEILQIEKDNKQTSESLLRVEEIVEESSKIVENSTAPNEIILDSKILHTGVSYVSVNVSSLNTNLTLFSEAKYISGLMSFIENSNEIVPSGKEWKCFGSVTYHMFKKSHPITYMLGTFTFEPPPVKERAKCERKSLKKTPEKKVLSKAVEKQKPAEPGSDVYDHILKFLIREYKKNQKKPINYFNFIIDPTDYWQTIENIFHFAFLVRDGTAKMIIENGLPHIEPMNKPGEKSEGRQCNNQFCFRLSVEEWKECIKHFEVRSPSIPPFVKKR